MNNNQPINKKLLLFIHGLGGSPDKTWGDFKKLIEQDEELNPIFDVDFYGYNTGFLHIPIFDKYPRIQTLADGLSTKIETDFNKFQSIILVCHSLGGLIAKRYLVDTKVNKDRHRINGILFFSVPNNGNDLAKLAGNIPFTNIQIHQISTDSDFIYDLEKYWHRFELENEITTKYIIAIDDKVVEENSGSGGWDKPDVIMNRGHIDIIKPTSHKEQSFTILKRFALSTDNYQHKHNPITKKDRLNKLLKLSKIIYNQARLSFSENQNTLFPFLQDSTKRNLVYKKIFELSRKQKNSGTFGKWKGILTKIREEESNNNEEVTDNNTVFFTVNSLLDIVERLYQSFYEERQHSPENPHTKISVAYALDKKNGFNDIQASEVANSYLNSLSHSVDKLAENIGKMEVMLEKY